MSILLVGCSIQKISGPMEKDLEGPNIALKIAVVGANDLVKVENVDYVKKDLKELISHSEEIFDGLIISQDSIEEASKKSIEIILNILNIQFSLLEQKTYLLQCFAQIM